jgi:hypothetical protein
MSRPDAGEVFLPRQVRGRVLPGLEPRHAGYNAPMFGLKKKLRLTDHASCAG